MVRIVIYDDNEQLRKSMQMLLLTQPGYEVVAVFDNANEVQRDIEQLHPDLVILDIDMPGRKGTEAVGLIKETDPNCLVVMHTVFEEEENLFASLCAGANGYILKKTSPDRFLAYIEEVLSGGAPFSPGIAQKVLTFFHHHRPLQHDYNLTEREKQILHLLVKGYTYKAISAELFIALDTSRKHIRNIYDKLHVNCGREAVALALQHKLTS
jgi:DNA-binding NarL/FixJ family response regulator